MFDDLVFSKNTRRFTVWYNIMIKKDMLIFRDYLNYVYLFIVKYMYLMVFISEWSAHIHPRSRNQYECF